MSEIRLVVADDSATFRAGLIALLGSVGGMTIVAEAADGNEATRTALQHQPDVVLMDLNMPATGGVAATRAIVAAAPHIAVLVLTMHDGDDSVMRAMQAGARGYLVKGARQSEIVRSIEVVADGGAVFGPAVARRLFGVLNAAAHATSTALFPELTAREREILELVARGRSNAEIAAALDLAPKTVRNHVSSVFTKLQVVDRAKAIIKARDAGIGQR